MAHAAQRNAPKGKRTTRRLTRHRRSDTLAGETWTLAPVRSTCAPAGRRLAMSCGRPPAFCLAPGPGLASAVGGASTGPFAGPGRFSRAAVCVLLLATAPQCARRLPPAASPAATTASAAAAAEAASSDAASRLASSGNLQAVAAARRVATIGAGELWGSKHHEEILAAELALFLDADGFRRARQIRAEPGMCTGRCDTAADCQPPESALSRDMVLCEDGFCVSHPCADGDYLYTEDEVCISEGGEWRQTVTCEIQADCEDAEKMRRGILRLGDECRDGRCQRRRTCTADWCRGDLRYSKFRLAACEGEKCVSRCQSDKDCLGWPNLPVDEQIPSRWYTCEQGTCRWKCTPELCSPAIEPSYHLFPKGMACTPR